MRSMAAALGPCREEDVPELLRFLNDHWKRGHAFTVSRPLFDWQHRENDGAYSFVLARRGRDGEIVGILGFLPTRHFDPALAGANTIWLTTWKVRDDAGDAGLGLRMLRFLTEREPHVAVGAITTHAALQPMYARLGYATGELQHYVMGAEVRLKPDMTATVVQAPVASGLSRTSLLRAEPFDEPYAFEAPACRGKTTRYIVGRYVNHPIYRYGVHALADETGTKAFLVTRVAEHAGRRTLRVVDFVGAPGLFAGTGPALQTLIEDHGADDADVYNAGIDPSVFATAGFTLVDPEGPLVVPDHFEPFEHRNVRLWYAMKSNSTPILFKGDADQDRPSQVASS